MLLISSQIVLVLSAILIPFYAKVRRSKPRFKIDTDTNDANYAINEHGLLERYNRVHLGDANHQVKD
jgi:hypothetical protein